MTDLSGITYDPNYLSVDYCGGVYDGRAAISFYTVKAEPIFGGKQPAGSLRYKREASEAEVIFLKQTSPEVFDRKGPRTMEDAKY